MNDVPNPGQYRPGAMFRHTVLDSPKVMGIDPATGELRYVNPGYTPRLGVVQPIDPTNPYDLAAPPPDAAA